MNLKRVCLGISCIKCLLLLQLEWLEERQGLPRPLPISTSLSESLSISLSRPLSLSLCFSLSPFSLSVSLPHSCVIQAFPWGFSLHELVWASWKVRAPGQWDPPHSCSGLQLQCPRARWAALPPVLASLLLSSWLQMRHKPPDPAGGRWPPPPSGPSWGVSSRLL